MITNTRHQVDFDYPLKDIKKDEELTHKYKSLEWRECFEDLRNILDLNNL